MKASCLCCLYIYINISVLTIEIILYLQQFFTGTRDVVLMFCHMNTSGSGALSSEEFSSIYDAITLQWDLQYSTIPWYRAAWWPLRMLCTGAHAAIKWPYFETLVCK